MMTNRTKVRDGGSESGNKLEGIKKHAKRLAAELAVLAVISTPFVIEGAEFDGTYFGLEAEIGLNFSGTVKVEEPMLGKIRLDLDKEYSMLPPLIGVQAIVKDIGVELNTDNIVSPENMEAVNKVTENFSFAQVAEDVDDVREQLSREIAEGYAGYMGAGMIGLEAIFLLSRKYKWNKRQTAAALAVISVMAGSTLFATGTVEDTVESLQQDFAPVHASQAMIIDTPYGSLGVSGVARGLVRYGQELIEKNDREAMAFVDKAKANVADAYQDKKYCADWNTDIIIHVSDIHGNFYMAEVVAEIAKQSGAKIILDTGDLTTAGTRIEGYHVEKIINAFKQAGVEVATVLGNHDTKTTGVQAEAAGAVVLDYEVANVGGYNILGAPYPMYYVTNLDNAGQEKRNDAVEKARVKLQKVLTASEDDGVPIDFGQTHTSAMSELEHDWRDNIINLSGHLHPDSAIVQSDGIDATFIASNTNGANRNMSDALVGSSIGVPSRPVEILVYMMGNRDKPGEHSMENYYIAKVTPDGSFELGELMSISQVSDFQFMD